MSQSPNGSQIVLGVVGAIIGAAVGGFAFLFAFREGFYLLAFPGAAIGIGCGLLSKTRAVPLAIICGVIAFPLSILLEWRVRPFRADASLNYFLTHLHQLTSMTMIMVVLGVVFAVWFGLGRGGSQPFSAGVRPPDPPA